MYSSILTKVISETCEVITFHTPSTDLRQILQSSKVHSLATTTAEGYTAAAQQLEATGLMRILERIGRETEGFGDGLCRVRRAVGVLEEELRDAYDDIKNR